jgi:alkyl hydroperoxide reductase subunit F
VLAVPTVFLNGEVFDQGRMTLEQIVAKLDTGAAGDAAPSASPPRSRSTCSSSAVVPPARPPIYAARKGIRTGIAAERFGGQVLDTMAIENFISVPYTEGPEARDRPRAARARVRRRRHEPAARQAPRPRRRGGRPRHRRARQRRVTARPTVVLSTGARWRNMNVPGETEYRNKGVTYCPHCDGPLFKGKRVAVIGGGNSGVEAAIDLAGVVAHVTLIEFDGALRADEVLQRKLRSLPNVDIIVSALTTEVLGDGEPVTGLVYTDRTTDESHASTSTASSCRSACCPTPSGWPGSVELSPAARSWSTTAARPRCPACSPPATAPRCRTSRSSWRWAAGATRGTSARSTT